MHEEIEILNRKPKYTENEDTNMPIEFFNSFQSVLHTVTFKNVVYLKLYQSKLNTVYKFYIYIRIRFYTF